jgi:hypothetical protein
MYTDRQVERSRSANSVKESIHRDETIDTMNFLTIIC